MHFFFQSNKCKFQIQYVTKKICVFFFKFNFFFLFYFAVFRSKDVMSKQQIIEVINNYIGAEVRSFQFVAHFNLKVVDIFCAVNYFVAQSQLLIFYSVIFFFSWFGHFYVVGFSVHSLILWLLIALAKQTIVVPEVLRDISIFLHFFDTSNKGTWQPAYKKFFKEKKLNFETQMECNYIKSTIIGCLLDKGD